MRKILHLNSFTLLKPAIAFAFALGLMNMASAQVKVTYSSPGSETFVVPIGVTQITIKAWGAGGGGGGGGSARTGGNGGGAAFVQTTLTVTPGETLNLRIGGGGPFGTYLSTSNQVGSGGGGGGYSGVFRGTITQANALLIAGSGGGGGGGDNQTDAPNGGAGGFGGTATASGSGGGAGTGVTGGGGGTNTAGGAAGSGDGSPTTGSALAGGNGGHLVNPRISGGINGGGQGGGGNVSAGRPGGGGGGAGYFGGGGGGAANTGDRSGAGGGGGSSRVTGSNTNIVAGSGQNPGNSSDPDYMTGRGRGGNGGATGSNGAAGGAGLIVINYTPAYVAEFISMDFGSTQWCLGETRTVSVTVKNVGQATWNTDFTTNIGVKWNTDGNSWSDYHVRVSAGNLAPGQTGTYNLTIPAVKSDGTTLLYNTPLDPGTNNLTFDVVNEGNCWFGDNNGSCGPGNTVFTSANLTINPLPTATVSNQANISCYLGENGSITITASGGTGPYQYSIDNGASYVSGSNPYTFTGLSAGTYYPRVKDANGCESPSCP